MNLSKAKDTTYHSFQEFAEAVNGKPVVLHTTNEEKLLSQKEKIVGKCAVCKQPLTYHGGNVVTCNNPSCKGTERTIIDKETGEEKTIYKPYFKLLTKKDSEFARRIFS